MLQNKLWMYYGPNCIKIFYALNVCGLRHVNYWTHTNETISFSVAYQFCIEIEPLSEIKYVFVYLFKIPRGENHYDPKFIVLFLLDLIFIEKLYLLQNPFPNDIRFTSLVAYKNWFSCKIMKIKYGVLNEQCGVVVETNLK